MGLDFDCCFIYNKHRIALNAISIATGNIGGIISIIISGIILYYLYRPHVKAYFGKAIRSDATPAA
jgi:hypothetical protein